MEKEKNQYVHFPLCCLNYDKDISKTAELLISYGIIEFAKQLEKDIELNDSDIDRIEKYIDDNDLFNVEEDDYFIILSAFKLGIDISSINNTKQNHSKLNSYINSFEFKHGKDAKIRMHKTILFEVRDRQFNERLFRVYCGILSVIGDKGFIRITNKRISYRMLGFKSEDVFSKEKSNYKLMTARQIKTCSDKLCEKNLFDKLTYRNRLTFYSTKFRGKAFQEVLTNSIALNKVKKNVNRILNEKLTNDVEIKQREFNEKLISGLTVKEIKCEMELYKAG